MAGCRYGRPCEDFYDQDLGVACVINGDRVEVVRQRCGAPRVALHGRAQELASERGVRAWHLSLTHTEQMALAVAIAVG